jgi:hypothetical protein
MSSSIFSSADVAALLELQAAGLIHTYTRVPILYSVTPDTYGNYPVDPDASTAAAISGVPCYFEERQVLSSDGRGAVVATKSVLVVAPDDPIKEGTHIVRDVLSTSGQPLLPGDTPVGSVNDIAPSGPILRREVDLKGGHVG